MNNQPIGILDSGIGGLSIWKEIVTHLPHESTIYVADSANCPYGTKSETEIYSLAHRLVQFLMNKHVKLIVVACNTITVSCLDTLRAEFSHVPMVGIVPVVKTAAELTLNKKIGIFSTSRTSKSDYQRGLIDQFAKGCEVVSVGTDKLVPFIEEGHLGNVQFKSILKEELQTFVQNKVDTIALGCSHFPFIRDQIQEAVGPEVQLLDSGGAVARQVGRILTHNHIQSEKSSPVHQFFTTGKKEQFVSTGAQLLGGEYEEIIRKVEEVSV